MAGVKSLILRSEENRGKAGREEIKKLKEKSSRKQENVSEIGLEAKNYPKIHDKTIEFEYSDQLR